MNAFNKSPESFPTGAERKAVFSKNQEAIENFKKKGFQKIKDYKHYTWLDSELDDDGFEKGSSFYNSFKRVLPKRERSLKKYIEKTLLERKGNAVGIEFGGRGVKLFEGFSSGFFKLSAGVTLVNYVDATKVSKVKSLFRRGKEGSHKILEADILSPDTYDSLDKILEGEQADFIIERIGKGLEFIPSLPYEMSRILQRWYTFLREDGIMLVQTPVVFNNLIDQWGTMIKEKYKGVLELEYFIGFSNVSPEAGSVFRLRKLPNAPKDLPFLDPRTVYKIPIHKERL